MRALSDDVAKAEDALARLDERLAAKVANPLTCVSQTWRDRTHFSDAAASLWLDGDLVPLEDLVLHDAAADIRAPTHALVRCHAALRARRRIAAAKPGWALSPAGLDVLRGRRADGDRVASETKAPMMSADGLAAEEAGFAAELAAQLAAMDALLARTGRVLAQRVVADPEARDIDVRDIDVRDIEATDIEAKDIEPREADGIKPPSASDMHDETDRLRQWQEIVDATAALAPTRAAAIAGAAWEDLAPLQHAAWLGRLLVCDLLRAREKARHHLPCLNLGLQAVARTRRRATDRTTREAAWLAAITEAAELGLREHDRWSLARQVLQKKLQGRRRNSKLPQLIDLVLARPLVTAGIISNNLEVSQRGALDLVAALDLRELTGRGRYRAWAVL